MSGNRLQSVGMAFCALVIASSGAFVGIVASPRASASSDVSASSGFVPEPVVVDDGVATARIRYVSFDGEDLCVSWGFERCFGCHVAVKANGFDGSEMGKAEHDVAGDELGEFELRVPVGEDGWFEVASVDVSVSGATMAECDVAKMLMDSQKSIAERLSSEAAAIIDVSKSGMLERREADKAAAERARREVAEAKRKAEEESKERAAREEEAARARADELARREAESQRRAAEEASRQPTSQTSPTSAPSQSPQPAAPASDVERRACDVARSSAGGSAFCVVIDLSTSTLYGCGQLGGNWSVGRTAHVLSVGSFGEGTTSVVRKAPSDGDGSYGNDGTHRWFVALSERFQTASPDANAGRYIDGLGWWDARGICSGAGASDPNICLADDDARWLHSVCETGTSVVIMGSL